MPTAGGNDLDGHMQAVDLDEQDTHSQLPLLGAYHKQPVTASPKLPLLFRDWWLWEIVSAGTASLAIVVIIIIFALFDQSSLPDWPSVFTINSVISLFATVAKLSITSAVGASISQSKWLWYRQGEPRPLGDLQLFDDASRGPWGAMSLLISIKTRHPTFVGAIIITMMLLFDPFLQQVVVYPDRLVASDKAATIVRAQRYQARSYEDLPLPSVVDISMKAAIYSGVFDVDDRVNVRVDHHCSTGNCTWNKFASLAICGKCLDITSLVEKTCNEGGCYKLHLPGGPSLLGSGGQINSTVSHISKDLDDIEASVVRFSSLSYKRMNDRDSLIGMECVLSYCVNMYHASVTNGDIEQRIDESWRNNSASHSQGADLIYRPPQSIMNLTANASTFKVASLAAKAMNEFMSSTFTGSGWINSSGSGSAFSSDVIHALYNTNNYFKSIESLATSMTNNIRQQNDSDSSPFEGVAYQTETYVHVRWAWFTYPATVLALSLLYLLGTMIESRDRNILVWKSSSLALLLHGQDLELSKSAHMPINTVSEMTEMAKDLEIELIQTIDDRWILAKR